MSTDAEKTNTKTRYTTDPTDRLPVIEKTAYGAGNVTTMLGKQAPKVFTFQIYNIELGVAPHLIGAVLFFARFWDAMVDPLVGSISDNCSSKWGRRRPFILVGALLSGFFFASLWWFPSGWSEMQYFAYFCVTALLFYTAFSFYTVPWYALGYEMSPDYHERTRIMSYASVFGTLAQIGVSWLYWIVKRPMFDSTIEGVRWVGSGAGFALFLFGLATVFLTKESHERYRAPKVKKTPIRQSIAQAIRNKPFLIVASTVAIILICSSLVGGLMPYINIYYVFNGEKAAASTFIGYYGTAMQLSGLASIPLMTRFSIRFGKIRALKVSFVLASAGFLSTWLLFDPASPYLQLFPAVLKGIGTTAIFMLCHAMIGDVCDVDELENGTRREGLFGAVYAWMFKMGIAIAILISGYLLTWTGFDASLGANQPAGTLTWIRASFAIIPVVGYVICYLLLTRYSLTEARSYAIRETLKERRSGMD